MRAIVAMLSTTGRKIKATSGQPRKLAEPAFCAIRGGPIKIPTPTMMFMFIKTAVQKEILWDDIENLPKRNNELFCYNCTRYMDIMQSKKPKWSGFLTILIIVVFYINPLFIVNF
jgi:hypothetical protein